MRRDRNARGQTRNSGVNLTRRNLLQRAGWVTAAATLPGVMGRSIALASENASPVMAKLSAYMSEARNRALPDEVLEKAKHHILDTFAAMVSGSQLPPGKAVLRFANSYGGGSSTVVCSKVLCGRSKRPS
jgi:hypothetical protein